MSGTYPRIDAVLAKLTDADKFTPPIYICTLGSERSWRENIASSVTARQDDGNHLIGIVTNETNENEGLSGQIQ